MFVSRQTVTRQQAPSRIYNNNYNVALFLVRSFAAYARLNQPTFYSPFQRGAFLGYKA
jgi:hypothetical protein